MHQHPFLLDRDLVLSYFTFYGPSWKPKWDFSLLSLGLEWPSQPQFICWQTFEISWDIKNIAFISFDFFVNAQLERYLIFNCNRVPFLIRLDFSF